MNYQVYGLPNGVMQNSKIKSAIQAEEMIGKRSGTSRGTHLQMNDGKREYRMGNKHERALFCSSRGISLECGR